MTEETQAQQTQQTQQERNVAINTKLIALAVEDAGSFIASSTRVVTRPPEQHGNAVPTIFETATTLIVVLTHIVEGFGFTEEELSAILASKNEKVVALTADVPLN